MKITILIIERKVIHMTKTYFVEFKINDGRKVKVLYTDPAKKEEKVERLKADYPEAVETDDGYFYM